MLQPASPRVTLLQLFQIQQLRHRFYWRKLSDFTFVLAAALPAAVKSFLQNCISCLQICFSRSGFAFAEAASASMCLHPSTLKQLQRSPRCFRMRHSGFSQFASAKANFRCYHHSVGMPLLELVKQPGPSSVGISSSSASSSVRIVIRQKKKGRDQSRPVGLVFARESD